VMLLAVTRRPPAVHGPTSASSTMLAVIVAPHAGAALAGAIGPAVDISVATVRSSAALYPVLLIVRRSSRSPSSLARPTVLDRHQIERRRLFMLSAKRAGRRTGAGVGVTMVASSALEPVYRLHSGQPGTVTTDGESPCPPVRAAEWRWSLVRRSPDVQRRRLPPASREMMSSVPQGATVTPSPFSDRAA
jgi:hypothetical protein